MNAPGVNGVVVTQRKSKNNPQHFAYVNTIIYNISTNKFLLLIEDLITLEYNKHHTGYIIDEQKDSIQKILNFDQLAHYAPLHTYSIKSLLGQKF